MMTQIALWFLSPLLGMLTVAGVLGGLCIAIFFLAPAWLPFNRMNFLWLGIALLSGGAFYWWAFHAGEHHMAQMIAAKDEAAIARVTDALKNVEACNGGLDWNVVTGRCDSK